VNWALDGLEQQVIKKILINYKGHNDFIYNNKQLQDFSSISWVVRHQDNFIIGLYNQVNMLAIKNTLEVFLFQRGLRFSKERTKIIKWSFNSKFNFLGWSYHFLIPKHTSRIVRVPKNKVGKLSNWAGIYMYPSFFSIKKLKQKVKILTSLRNSWITLEILIKLIRFFILRWSSYFSLGFNQGRLRAQLDWYIFKRVKRFIFKKYGHKYLKYYLLLNQAKDGSKKKYISFSYIIENRTFTFRIPRLSDIKTTRKYNVLLSIERFVNRNFYINFI
jgi:hypothetical protein